MSNEQEALLMANMSSLDILSLLLHVADYFLDFTKKII